LQFVALCVATPFLLFPKPHTFWIALAFPLTCVARTWNGQPILPRTPLNPIILMLLLMVLTSLWATFDVLFSLGKVAGVTLGLYWYFFLVQFAETASRFSMVLAAHCAGGVTLVGLGLVGTQWKGRFATIGAVIRLFPLRVKGVPGAEGGFYPNALGGSMLLFVPLLAALLYSALRHWHVPSVRRTVLGIGIALALLLTFCMLVISESRSAWLGLTGAVLVLGLLYSWRRPRLWIPTLFLIAGIVVATSITRPWGQLQVDNAPVRASGEISLAGRLEIWRRAIYGIQDFPFTGMGMNSFRKLMPVLYPASHIPSEVDIASAHNHLLQTALDLGIPGLIAYIALWGATARMLWQIGTTTTDPLKRSLAVGLGVGLAAQFLFQIGDAIPLGAKVGIFFWFTLGLAVPLWSLHLHTISADFVASWNIRMLDVFAAWICSSLLAISLIGNYPHFALGIACVGGVLTGWWAMERSFSEQRNKKHQSRT
jgi:putative inorganic carbon (HCO3(-)) transporter